MNQNDFRALLAGEGLSTDHKSTGPNKTRSSLLTGSGNFNKRKRGAEVASSSSSIFEKSDIFARPRNLGTFKNQKESQNTNSNTGYRDRAKEREEQYVEDKPRVKGLDFEALRKAKEEVKNVIKIKDQLEIVSCGEVEHNEDEGQEGDLDKEIERIARQKEKEKIERKVLSKADLLKKLVKKRESKAFVQAKAEMIPSMTSDHSEEQEDDNIFNIEGEYDPFSEVSKIEGEKQEMSKIEDANRNYFGKNLNQDEEDHIVVPEGDDMQDEKPMKNSKFSSDVHLQQVLKKAAAIEKEREKKQIEKQQHENALLGNQGLRLDSFNDYEVCDGDSEEEEEVSAKSKKSKTKKR